MAKADLYETRACSYCGAPVQRPRAQFSHGTIGPLAGKVFCDRECQKRMFRGVVKCGWPGCDGERQIEGATYRRKQAKAFFCDVHTDMVEIATGYRIATQKRLSWLQDSPIGHRHVTAVFYRWTVFVLSGEKCAACGASLTLGPGCHIDHKVPVSEGGETRLSNMQPLCVACHKQKSSLEQRLVNQRRWLGRGPHNRHMTHLEKDQLIERLRTRLKALGAPTD